jgi:hypothetical protein
MFGAAGCTTTEQAARVHLHKIRCLHKNLS